MGYKLSELTTSLKANLTDIFHLRTTAGVDKQITGASFVESFIVDTLELTASGTVDLSNYNGDLFISVTAGDTLTLTNSLNEGRRLRIRNHKTTALVLIGAWPTPYTLINAYADIELHTYDGYTRVASPIYRQILVNSDYENALSLYAKDLQDIALIFGSNEIERWGLVYSPTDQSLSIQRKDSSGVLLGTTISISNTTGAITAEGDITAGGDITCPGIILQSDSNTEIFFKEGGDTKAVIFNRIASNTLRINVYDTSAVSRQAIEIDNDTGEVSLKQDTTIEGTLDCSTTLNVNGAGTNGKAEITPSTIELGKGRTADSTAYIDFIADTVNSDYGFRVRRYTGENGNSELLHKGTGVLLLTCASSSGSIQLDGTTTVSDELSATVFAGATSKHITNYRRYYPSTGFNLTVGADIRLGFAPSSTKDEVFDALSSYLDTYDYLGVSGSMTISGVKYALDYFFRETSSVIRLYGRHEDTSIYAIVSGSSVTIDGSLIFNFVNA